MSNGDSFHHYAFSNAERNDGVFAYTHFTPVAPSITLAGTFSPSSSDLLQISVSGTVSIGNFNRESILGRLGVLSNGLFDIGAGVNRPEMVSTESNASITYTLDTSVNTFGYDVSSIIGFGGWGDSGRDEQRYSVFVSVVGSSDFFLYGQVSENPSSLGSPSGVGAQFDGAFSCVDGVENGFAGFGEVDVIGTANIPEQTAAVSLIGVLGMLLGLRRRRK